MTKALKDVLKAARRLSQAEQDELVRELWDIYEPMKSIDEILTDELKAELRRRAAYTDKHPESVLPHDEAMRRVRATLESETASE